MPRAFRADAGDDGIVAPERGSGWDANTLPTSLVRPGTYTQNHQTNLVAASRSENNNNNEDTELRELERRLNEEVDEDFFAEPRTFNTLQRVIDVLGLQMVDDATLQQTTELAKNPAYRQLKVQQQIVEGAIEHMAVIHCADLNGSVIQVGRVARQFSEAVSKVRMLRKQVRDIQDTLGAAQQHANPNEAAVIVANRANGGGGAGTDDTTNRTSNAAAMSLRELWLKKLECEATLSLLAKLDIIRIAPGKFDQLLLRPPCRIGAAIMTLTEALQTMFSDDVAQVQALHKIMEQLMLRKQRAEEFLWDTLHEVIFLRTGNGIVSPNNQDDKTSTSGSTGVVDAAAMAKKGVTGGVSTGNSSVGGDSKRKGSNRVLFKTAMNASAGVQYEAGMINPFFGNHRRFAVDEDMDGDNNSINSDGSGASLFSLEEDDFDDVMMTGTDTFSSSSDGGNGKKNLDGSLMTKRNMKNSGGSRSGRPMMIPIPIIEAELDLEADERRCLEEVALSGMSMQPIPSSSGSTTRQRHLPRYADPILALRILAECLAQLKRLDDCERILGEGVEREIRRIVQREQARTFIRLDKLARAQNVRGSGVTSNKNTHKMENMKEFRRHLIGLLSAFGCVMLRLGHLAEILRVRIGSEKELMQTMESPTSIMAPVLAVAYDIMQREIKVFLKACLVQTEPTRHDPMESSGEKGSTQYETGLFSLGIVEKNSRPGQQAVSTATRSNVMEMTTSKFVSNVLFPKTKSQPQVRHALNFRRSVAKWTTEVDTLRKELAMITGEDTSAPSYNVSREKSAIAFLDGVIQDQLLPVLQEEAVNGTVMGLERNDAFSPNLDRSLYARPNSNEPQDVDMCLACQAIYNSTGPLFLALHRLPRGGEMYLPLVAVLEHVMLIFISRVQQQVDKICAGKTAYDLLTKKSDGHSLGVTVERRRAFTLLMLAYADGETLESSTATDNLAKQSGLMPLSPPKTDTSPRKVVSEPKIDSSLEDIADGVEGEERLLDEELKFLETYFEFDAGDTEVTVCVDEELMRGACLAHSLLKLSGLLDSRLKIRGTTFNKTLASTRALQEAIKSIKQSAVLMAKFCRLDMLMQCVIRLSKVPNSSTMVARDAVRIPSSVNDLGEYLTGASDNIREAAGNAVTAYTFSSLEQYIPYCLMQIVRTLAAGKGIIAKAPLTMNGIEALDRSGSVLYRDLKGATSFDNSFWDVELAAVSFERSASFMAMMELEMEELVAYYSANQEDFSEEDFMLMFAMTGPRRRGDINQFHIMKRRMK